MKALKIALAVVLIAFVAPVLARGAAWLASDRPASWRQADWSSAGILPDPRRDPSASIRVLAARAGGLKGIVAVHSWLVLKRAGEDRYTRYDVLGWGDPVRRNTQPADGRWFSNVPRIVYALEGPEAERLIPKVEAAIRDYRYARRGAYRIWPGPNSNTFVAGVLAAVPELKAALPPTAIGRDYPVGSWLGRTNEGGVRLTLGGFAALTLGPREGIEVSLGGLVAGVRFDGFAILLPGFGALGLGEHRQAI